MKNPAAVILASTFLAVPHAFAADAPSGGVQTPGGVQAPGTSFPQNPTSPNSPAAPGVPVTPEARTGARVLNDVRAAVSQLPGQNPSGTLPGTEVENARIRDLRVFRREGRIVLTGVVDSQAEKEAAGNRAFQAAGEPILNQLEVR